MGRIELFYRLASYACANGRWRKFRRDELSVKNWQMKCRLAVSLDTQRRLNNAREMCGGTQRV
jgi:hypothetical protein